MPEILHKIDCLRKKNKGRILHNLSSLRPHSPTRTVLCSAHGKRGGSSDRVSVLSSPVFLLTLEWTYLGHYFSPLVMGSYPYSLLQVLYLSFGSSASSPFFSFFPSSFLFPLFSETPLLLSPGPLPHSITFSPFHLSLDNLHCYTGIMERQEKEPNERSSQSRREHPINF